MEKPKTFKEIVDEMPDISPKVALVRDLMRITGAGKANVYRWLSGDVVPVRSAQILIAKFLEKPVSELFPTNNYRKTN